MSRDAVAGREFSATPLLAVGSLTFLASIGTGVVWNGVSFIAKADYGLSQSEVSWMYLSFGVIYIVGSLAAGRILRSVRRVMSPRAVLCIVLTACALVCTLPAVFRGAWALWVVAAANSLLSSILWPVVESYVTAGRHGAAMRSAIGWWNLAWTTATALSLIGMAPLMETNPRMAIVWLGAINLLALIPLLGFQRQPGSHDAEAAAETVSREYPLLLQAARMMLPLGYVLNAAMTPLLPFLLDRFDLTDGWLTPIAATWMVSRVVAMTLMWRMGFWHGRWGTLLLGGVLIALGFSVIVLSLSMITMMTGLALFGAGMGIVYYAAIYYAMAVGHGEVDAGGTHEALIGVGYTLGPGAGLIGLEVTAGLRDRGYQVWDGAGVVGVVLSITAVCGIQAVRIYLRARRSRVDWSHSAD